MRSTGMMKRKKKSESMANPFAARVTTPWSQAKIASSYSLVTRSQRAVIYPATKMLRVRTEKGCMRRDCGGRLIAARCDYCRRGRRQCDLGWVTVRDITDIRRRPV